MQQRFPAIRAGWYKAGVGVAVVALGLTACSSSKKASPVTTPQKESLNTINSGTAVKGGSIVYDVEKTVDFFNTLDANGNTDVSGVVYNALLPSPFIPQPDYSLKLNTDLLVSAEKTSDSPETLVYKINPKAVWNDGTPITAEDFIYAWITESGVDGEITAASTSGYQNIDKVVGSDNGSTVTVTFKTEPGNAFPDWQSLFTLLPAHIAEQHGYDKTLVAPVASNKGLEDSWTWFGANISTWSAGPYQIDAGSSNTDGTKIVLVPNTKWYGKTGPFYDKITFNYVKDAAQEPTAMANGEAQVIYPQPQTSLVTTVKAMDPSKIKYQISKGLSFEHFDLNLRNSFLGGDTQAEQQNPVKLALRQAIFTATDRQDIINKTIGLFDSTTKPLDNRMYVNGQAGYKDNVASQDLGQGDVAKATSILKAAGYTNIGPGQKLTTPDGKVVQDFNIRYTQGNAIRKSECELFQTQMAKIGITIVVNPTDSLNKTLNQADANHAFDIVVFGWLARRSRTRATRRCTSATPSRAPSPVATTATTSTATWTRG